MVVSVLLLVVVTTAFLAVVWGVVLFFTVLFFGSSHGFLLATLFTGLLTALLVYLEFGQRHSISERADAEPVTRDEYPELYNRVTRLAKQYDVPVPEIAISEGREPKALVVGYRSENTLLILSTGTLETLSEPELEAVLAHELAHIANKDAMVMTAVSLPVMFADGLRSRLMSIVAGPQDTAGGHNRSRGRARGGVAVTSRDGARGLAIAVVIIGTAKLLLITVSTVTWVLARTIVGVLSRSRELAADRAAAHVLGSSSQLSSALVRLDESVEEIPRHDLREVSDISSLSIVPLEPPTVEPTMLGPEGNRTPFLWSVRGPLKRAKKRLFRTHPRTQKRIERLSGLDTQSE
jgi:heat shock protein HtpX